MANRARRRTVSAAPQQVAVAAQLQGWDVGMGVVGHVRFLSEHFWIDGANAAAALAQHGQGRALPEPCPSIQVPSSLPCAQSVLSE